MLTITTPSGRPTCLTRQDKEIKCIQISKEEVKLSLFTDGVISDIENPKESTKNLLELKNKSAKFQYTKLSQKSVVFYTLTAYSEK